MTVGGTLLGAVLPGGGYGAGGKALAKYGDEVAQGLSKIKNFLKDEAGSVPGPRFGTKPKNLSPPGSGRRGAFNEAKRQSGIPTSQQPSSVRPNIDKKGNRQPGRVYEFETPGGGSKTIRDDLGGHN